MSKYIEEVKQYFLMLAKEQKLDVGHTLALNITTLNLRLNHPQSAVAEQAIEELIKDDYFVINKNGSYALTEKGKEFIY